jgi:hypothetical protein
MVNGIDQLKGKRIKNSLIHQGEILEKRKKMTEEY